MREGGGKKGVRGREGSEGKRKGVRGKEWDEGERRDSKEWKKVMGGTKR